MTTIQYPQELQIMMKNSEQIKNNDEQIKNVNEQIKNFNEQSKNNDNLIKNVNAALMADTIVQAARNAVTCKPPTFSGMTAKQIFNHFIQRQHDSECVNIYRQLPQEIQKEIDILTSEQSIKNQIMMKEMDEQSRQNQIMMKEMDEQIKNMDDILKGMDEMSRQNQILIKEMAEEHIQHEKRNEEILQEIEMYKELNRQLDVALKDNKYF
jgi:hypothetical protein